LKASYSRVRVTPPDVTTFPKQHKEEPLFYAAHLMGFGSIQLRLQGNVVISVQRYSKFTKKQRI